MKSATGSCRAITSQPTPSREYRIQSQRASRPVDTSIQPLLEYALVIALRAQNWLLNLIAGAWQVRFEFYLEMLFRGITVCNAQGSIPEVLQHLHRSIMDLGSF